MPCGKCAHAVYQGPTGREDGASGFWCERMRDNWRRERCGHYEEGEPRRLGERGRGK